MVMVMGFPRRLVLVMSDMLSVHGADSIVRYVCTLRVNDAALLQKMCCR